MAAGPHTPDTTCMTVRALSHGGVSTRSVSPYAVLSSDSPGAMLTALRGIGAWRAILAPRAKITHVATRLTPKRCSCIRPASTPEARSPHKSLHRNNVNPCHHAASAAHGAAPGCVAPKTVVAFALVWRCVARRAEVTHARTGRVTKNSRREHLANLGRSSLYGRLCAHLASAEGFVCRPCLHALMRRDGGGTGRPAKAGLLRPRACGGAAGVYHACGGSTVLHVHLHLVESRRLSVLQ